MHFLGPYRSADLSYAFEIQMKQFSNATDGIES
jgi:hypothetical protein